MRGGGGGRGTLIALWCGLLGGCSPLPGDLGPPGFDGAIRIDAGAGRDAAGVAMSREGGVPGDIGAATDIADGADPGGAPLSPGDLVTYEALDFESLQPVTLASLRGEAILMVSFSTWCVVCRHELPQLEAFYQGLDRPLRVVAIDVDLLGEHGTAQRMVTGVGLTTTIWADPADLYSALFGALGVPTVVLLDRDGRLVKVWQSAVDFTDPAFLSILDTVAPAGP